MHGKVPIVPCIGLNSRGPKQTVELLLVEVGDARESRAGNEGVGGSGCFFVGVLLSSVNAQHAGGTGEVSDVSGLGGSLEGGGVHGV